MIERELIKREILQIVSEYDELVRLYGSFNHNAFHYFENSSISFSDFDLFMKVNDDSTKALDLQNEIFNRIEKNTGLSLRVSVRRTRIHDNRLNFKQSFLISRFETLFKLANNFEANHSNYQCARFILRTQCANQYFDIDFNSNNLINSGVSHEEADFLFKIKTGDINCHSSIGFNKKLDNIMKNNPDISSHVKILQSASSILLEVKRVLGFANAIFTNRPDIITDLDSKFNQISS